jgi:hypothetical protein
MSAIGDLDDQVTAAEKSVEDLKRRAAELKDVAETDKDKSATMNNEPTPVDKPFRRVSTPEKPNYMMRNILVLGVIAFAAVMFFRKK